MPEGFYDQFKTPQSVAPGERANLPVIGDITKSLSGALGSTGLSKTGVDSVSSSADSGSFWNGGWSSFSTKKAPVRNSELPEKRDQSPEDNTEEYIKKVSAQGAIEGKRDNTARLGMLVYPSDLRRYAIKFSFAEYVRPNAFQKIEYNFTDHIALPMPASLAELTGVALNTQSFKPLEGVITENVAASVNSVESRLKRENINTDTFASAIQGGMGSIAKDNVKGALYATAVDVVGKIDETAAGTFQQLAGAIVNPHLTVMFQGVNLRTHRFSWMFAPHSLDESQKLQEIIRLFKKKMLPHKSTTSEAHMLDYPSIVKISLEPNEDQLYKFKNCMLSSVNVNYAPMGTPSFFKDSRYPTHIALDLSFQEVEIFTSSDIPE